MSELRGKRFLTRFVRPVIKFLRALAGNKKACFGSIVLLLFILMATIGPNIIPLDLRSNYLERYQLPSTKHPLGTDFMGRDIFQQLVHGSRDVMITAFLGGLFAMLLGVVIGSVAGFGNRYTDMILMRIVDVFLTVPSFPVMMILAASFQVKDPVSIGLILAVWSWPGLARDIRSQILSLKQREFIEAAKMLDLGTTRILFNELVPNLMPYITVNFVRLVRGALTASVGLMFLGLIPYSPTNWGMMLNLAIFQTGSIYVPRGLFYVLAPMGSIILFQYGALCFAQGLDEWFNPRLRAHE